MGRTPANLRHRVLAVLVDAAVAVGVVAVASSLAVTLSVVTDGAVPLALLGPISAAAAVAWLLVQSAMQGGQGSVGMRLLGLRLAHADDDQDLGFGRALGRNLVWAVTGGVIVGVFSPLFDPSPWRRGWHDLASGAVMADAIPARTAAPRAVRLPEVAIEPAPARERVTPATPRIAPASPRVEPAVPRVEPAVVRVEPAVLHLDPVALRAEPAVLPAAAASTRLSAPAASVAIAPSPASWAPSAPRAAARIPRTLPVDVISTVPGVPTRGGVSPSAAQAAPPATLALLVWDDGTRHTVYDATLFGRSPAGEPGLRVTPVRDETLSISKTHFEIGADAQGTWIVDRHSLNGVVITRGGMPQRIVPGERARLWAGDVVDVGDRRVTVESAR
ncbi:RDD family protein [Microbacterium marinum]